MGSSARRGVRSKRARSFFIREFLMDDHGLAMIENILEFVILEKGVGIVRGEALLSASAFREIPGVAGCGGRSVFGR